MYYRRRCFGKADVNSKFVPHDENQVAISLKYPKYDIYYSIFKYNQEQKNKGDVKGLTNLVGDCLIWDFDDKENPENSRQDAISLCNKLLSNNIPEEAIRVAFSGSKGIHVRVNLNEDISVADCKSICTNLAKEYKSFDTVIYNANRIFRALGSYHKEANLYKIPLTLEELANLNIETIRELAKDQTVFEQTPIQYTTIDLPEHFKPPVEKVEPKIEPEGLPTIDFSKKIKGWSNCKWALYNGIGVEPSNRHEKILCVLATSKALNYTKDGAYYNAKHAYEKGLEIYGGEKKENWKEELLRDRDSVYSSDWKGGTYSCRDKENWLYEFCQSLGEHKCKHKDDEECFIEIEDFAAKFTDFAVNIDKNRLFFGIPEIDDKVMVTTSMLVGLLGAPSAGKTTLLLNFLEESNKKGIPSIFFSMDMGLPLVYLRLIQKLFGYDKQKVFDIFMNDERQRNEIVETIKETYKYTKFSFRTGLNTEQMRNAISDHQEKIGQKVKLVGIDYLECISGPYSDPNANVGLISQQCKDIANDFDTCVMLLLQTQKHIGDPSDPLLSMRNVKGASAIEQACATILTLSRPGFSALYPKDDKFASISLVKGRMDVLFTTDLGWNGLRGEFHSLTEEDKQLLDDVRNRKKEMDKEKKEDKAGW